MAASAEIRARAYLLLHAALGSELRSRYRAYLAEDRSRAYRDTAARLGRTLEHAVATVPHYRGAVATADIRVDPLAALAAFPILERETVRREGERLLSSVGDRRRWRRNASGGSTGEPVTLWQDPAHLARSVAIRNVYSTWAGGRLGEPELYIWGSERDIERGRASLRDRLGNRLLRRSLLNAFMLTEEAMLDIVRSVQAGPPRLVIAYAQAGCEVARFASRRGLSLPSQRGLIATAGTLYPFMREQLESAFGCPVLNRYGSRETGDMAGECEHRGGLHVLPWACHLEVVDARGAPVGPGEEGDVLVTCFTNAAMPLIRYRIGDRARLPSRPVPCPCGRATQMLERVTGRSVDMFVAADGTMVDGEYFAHILYFRPWLRQFQVVQTAVDRVLYRIATDAPVPEAERRRIAARTRAALGPGCAVDFERVDVIEPSASGKLRYTMREL